MFFKRKIKRVVKIEFDGVYGVFYFDSSLPIPKVGEYLWFQDVFKQGVVKTIFHKLENNIYETTIRVAVK